MKGDCVLVALCLFLLAEPSLGRIAVESLARKASETITTATVPLHAVKDQHVSTAPQDPASVRRAVSQSVDNKRHRLREPLAVKHSVAQNLATPVVPSTHRPPNPSTILDTPPPAAPGLAAYGAKSVEAAAGEDEQALLGPRIAVVALTCLFIGLAISRKGKVEGVEWARTGLFFLMTSFAMLMYSGLTEGHLPSYEPCPTEIADICQSDTTRVECDCLQAPNGKWIQSTNNYSISSVIDSGPAQMYTAVVGLMGAGCMAVHFVGHSRSKSKFAFIAGLLSFLSFGMTLSAGGQKNTTPHVICVGLYVVISVIHSFLEKKDAQAGFILLLGVAMAVGSFAIKSPIFTVVEGIFCITYYLRNAFAVIG